MPRASCTPNPKPETGLYLLVVDVTVKSLRSSCTEFYPQSLPSPKHFPRRDFLTQTHKLCTPNPQISILKPRTSTLNPQPSNLDPQPSALNPRPSTLSRPMAGITDPPHPSLKYPKPLTSNHQSFHSRLTASVDSRNDGGYLSPKSLQHNLYTQNPKPSHLNPD